MIYLNIVVEQCDGGGGVRVEGRKGMGRERRMGIFFLIFGEEAIPLGNHAVLFGHYHC